MNNFVIVVKERYKGETEAVEQVLGERKGIREAQRIYYKGGMQMVALLDEELRVVFKLERRCHCTNVQYDFGGRLDSKIAKCKLS